MSSIDPIPVLVGLLETGESSGIRWARWPIEVHAEGCVIRLRLAPTGPWREYPDFRSVAATAQRFDGLEDQQIVVSDQTGELVQLGGRLPTQQAIPSTGDPWEHAWTLEYWWSRPRWCDALAVTWPARELRLRLGIDLPALNTAADSFIQPQM